MRGKTERYQHCGDLRDDRRRRCRVEQQNAKENRDLFRKHSNNLFSRHSDEIVESFGLKKESDAKNEMWIPLPQLIYAALECKQLF